MNKTSFKKHAALTKDQNRGNLETVMNELWNSAGVPYYYYNQIPIFG